MVDRRRMSTDGWRLDGYTISSPCEPKGSGELMITRESTIPLFPKSKPLTIFCGYTALFVDWLIFNVPVNNFSVMLGRSHRFLGITSTIGE